MKRGRGSNNLRHGIQDWDPDLEIATAKALVVPAHAAQAVPDLKALGDKLAFELNFHPRFRQKVMLMRVKGRAGDEPPIIPEVQFHLTTSCWCSSRFVNFAISECLPPIEASSTPPVCCNGA